MEKKYSLERWFQIKHDKCGALFTIGTKSYTEAGTQYPSYLRCPNCRERIIKDHLFNEFISFLRSYMTLIKSFRDANSSIREIQDED